MLLQDANFYSNMMSEPMCYPSDQVRCYGTSERELGELEKEVNRMVMNGESVCLVEKSKEAPSLSQRKVEIVNPEKKFRRKEVQRQQIERQVSVESRPWSEAQLACCVCFALFASLLFCTGMVLS